MSQYKSFQNWNANQSKHDGTSETETLKKDLYLKLSILLRSVFRTPATYKMEPFVTIIIASSCWHLLQRAPSYKLKGS